MALRVSAAMALCLLFFLVAFAYCVPLEEAVAAVPGGEQGPLRLPSRDGSIVSDEVVLDGEVPMEDEEELEVVNPFAEPDPDRSLPEEELTALKPSAEDEQSDEKTKEQIGDEEEEEKEKKTKKNHDGGDKDEKEKTKNKRKKHDCKEKKEKTKKHDEGEEKTKKQIHRHRRVEKEKTKSRPHRNSGNDSDDDEDEQEKKAKRWRKAIGRRSMFGHGRRSQREEAQNEEVKN